MPATRRPRLSALAETKFNGLCDYAGVIANKVREDQTGWDYAVEFPPMPSDGPADLNPAKPMCMVQVKSTRGTAARTKVKLSNAVRFAQNPLPCFVVLFVFDEASPEPRAVYLRHIWQTEIAEALRRAREAYVDGTPLHRSSPSLIFDEAELCPPEALIGRLEETIAAHGPDYGAAKSAIAKFVGYEDGAGEATFTLALDDMEALVDVMLGRRENVEITGFRFQESRFGLPGRLDEFGFGRFSVDAKPRTSCRVVLRSAGGEELELEGALHTPDLPGLSPDLAKIRVQAEFLELICRFDGRTESKANFDFNRAISIAEAARVARFRALGDAGPLHVEILCPDKPPIDGILNVPSSEHASAWRRMDRALTGLLEFAPATRWPQGARFKLTDLAEGVGVIEEFIATITLPGQPIRMRPTNPASGGRAITVDTFHGPMYLDLGPTTLFAIYTADVDMREHEDHLEAILGEPRLSHRLVLPGDARRNWSYMRRQIELARETGPHGPRVLFSQLDDTPPPSRPPEDL